jgi:hypothetical protein
MEPWLGSTAEVFAVFVIHVLIICLMTRYNAFFGDQATTQLVLIFLWLKQNVIFHFAKVITFATIFFV